MVSGPTCWHVQLWFLWQFSRTNVHFLLKFLKTNVQFCSKHFPLALALSNWPRQASNQVSVETIWVLLIGSIRPPFRLSVIANETSTTEYSKHISSLAGAQYINFQHSISTLTDLFYPTQPCCSNWRNPETFLALLAFLRLLDLLDLLNFCISSELFGPVWTPC